MGAQEVEKIRTDKENLEQRLKYPGGRIMFVCDVCGVFINSTDNEARRADHYNGKQYLGWKAIRDKLKPLEKTQEIKANSSMRNSKMRARSSSASSFDRKNRKCCDEKTRDSNCKNKYEKRGKSKKNIN